MTGRDVRNVPEAQRLLRDGGLCSCWFRLPDDRPVMCGLPIDQPHDHWLPATPDPTIRDLCWRMLAWAIGWVSSPINSAAIAADHRAERRKRP